MFQLFTTKQIRNAFSFFILHGCVLLKVCLILFDRNGFRRVRMCGCDNWAGCRHVGGRQDHPDTAILCTHTHTHAYMHDAAFIYSVITNVHNQVK